MNAASLNSCQLIYRLMPGVEAHARLQTSKPNARSTIFKKTREVSELKRHGPVIAKYLVNIHPDTDAKSLVDFTTARPPRCFAFKTPQDEATVADIHVSATLRFADQIEICRPDWPRTDYHTQTGAVAHTGRKADVVS
jgi:hypothetical protein